jgi:uncharacterized protein YndB with AHSA1/START domain
MTNNINIVHICDAPPTLVWNAWTEPKRLHMWWGVKGNSMQIVTFNLRLKGTFHYSVTSPNNQKMYSKLVFEEIIKPIKLVFINSFTDEKANIIRNPFNSIWPLRVSNTLQLEEYELKTKMSLIAGPFEASKSEMQSFRKAHKSIQEGFNNSFNMLDQYLRKIQRNSDVSSWNNGTS